MIGFRRIRQIGIGELTEELADVVRAESRVAFGYEFIADVNESLSIGKLSRKDKIRTSIIYGSEISSYIFNIVDNEINYLNNEFMSEEKYFGALMIRSKDGSEVNIIFRLRTVGIDGYTQYRLAWKRVSEYEYACIEW